MTTPPLRPRRGITLVEALVSMFVAALAMISLLALFPLGALQMGQALKDSRCADAAVNAESLMRTHWQTHVVDPQPPTVPAELSTMAADPVFVDPIGMQSSAATVGGQSYLARLNLSLPVAPVPPATTPSRTPFNFQQAYRHCTLLDDMTFDAGGQPTRSATSPTAPGPVERAGRYNWTAVLQRTTRTPNVADLTILVFDGRAAGFPATETPFPNLTYSVGGTSLTITYTAPNKPAVGKGRWIMLATPAVAGSPARVSFYRVVSVNDDSTTSVVLELQSAIKPTHPVGSGTVAVVFSGLAEVFERPALTPQ